MVLSCVRRAETDANPSGAVDEGIEVCRVDEGFTNEVCASTVLASAPVASTYVIRML